LPKWIYYLCLPVGMALQCLGYIAYILSGGASAEDHGHDAALSD